MTAEKEPRTFTGAVGVADRRLSLVSADPRRIEAFRREHPGAREIDGTGKVLMPGLINTHCHVAMTLQRGYADDIALMKWLHEYIWPCEAQQTPDEIVLGAEMGIVEMLLGGVTLHALRPLAVTFSRMSVTPKQGSLISREIGFFRCPALAAVEQTVLTCVVLRLGGDCWYL